MISILVLSSDGYSDCWNPFFDLLFKNYPECVDHEILLSTNTKTYQHPNLKIKTITHNLEDAWSKRFRNSVLEASNDIIFVVVEDDFLRSRLDSELMNQFIELMNGNQQIDHIRLLSTFDRTKMKSSDLDHLEEIESVTKLRLTYLPALWKKDILLKYLTNFEAPFLAEKMADFKSWMCHDRFYAVSRDYVEKNGQFFDGMASGALFRGKWAHWMIDFCKENNIEIDFDVRGFATEEFRKTTRLNSRIAMMKNPISTLRSFLSLIFFAIKVKIFRIN